MRQSPGALDPSVPVPGAPVPGALGTREALDVEDVFADPAFEPFKARGAAFVVVRPDARSVVWANAAAAAHWASSHADALGLALFGPPPSDGAASRAGGWLAGLARGIAPGRPPQLARAGLVHGARMAPATVLARAWTQPGGPVLMGLATPVAPGRNPSPDAWRSHAWPREPEPVAPSAGSELQASVDGDAMAEHDAGESLARRSQLAVLRDRLHHAVDGTSSLRLLWRTDAAGAVTEIDAATLARLGSPVRFGQEALPEAVGRFDPVAGDALRAAFGTRSTWSNITADLPVADGAASAPWVLSASPAFAPDRSFAGFRGFGTLQLGGLRLAPSRARGAAPDRPAPDDAPAPEAPGPHPAPGREAEPATPRPVSANVVELRPSQAQVAGRGAAASPAPLAEPAHLADDDGAFLALGEALRAEIGGEDVAGSPTDRPPLPAPVGAPPHPREILEAEASSALSRVPVALLVVAGGTPTFANPAAATMLGYPAPDDLLAAGGGLLLAAPGTPDAGTLVLRDGGGQAVTLEGRGSAVAWSGDPATLWALTRVAEAAAVPPDDRVRAQARYLGDAEGRSGELLDRVDDAVALLDSEGRIRRLNRRGEAWFGQGGEALGQSFLHLLAPESHGAALALLGDVRHQRDGTGVAPLQRDVLARTAAPLPVPMLLTLGRLGLAGFYATLRDVTDLRRAEGESARAQRDHARDADRLTDMLATVSHEIRTPLNAILGFAEVMVDERFGPLGNPRYRDYLKDIHAAGTQVVSLLGDMLDLSRIEAGRHDIDLGAVDVNRIVTEIVHKMQPEAHHQRVIMRTSLANRMPPALADERSVRQIVQNLLSNAVQFNEPGGQVIVSTAEGDAGSVVLRIRDTGIGMTDDEIATALEPFGRSASPRPGGGNGLGLPLTRALVGANGGSLAIRSRPREGTLVEVTFAASPPEAARMPTP